MTVPRPGELARMREAQANAMADTCEILEPAGGTDDFNLPLDDYPEGGDPIACGYKPSSRREVQESGEVTMADAELRLPVGTSISRRARVKVTHRHGETLSPPLLYDVIGVPARGPSGLLVTLRGVRSG